MIESVLNCSTIAWPMILGGVLMFGVLALGGAALIKYLFFTGAKQAAA